MVLTGDTWISVACLNFRGRQCLLLALKTPGCHASDGRCKGCPDTSRESEDPEPSRQDTFLEFFLVRGALVPIDSPVLPGFVDRAWDGFGTTLGCFRMEGVEQIASIASVGGLFATLRSWRLADIPMCVPEIDTSSDLVGV